MRYEEPLYRPPSEAYSLIFQVTIGCSNNTCTFCSMYKDKKFRIRPMDEVLKDIKEMSHYADKVEKVFLADGNVLCMPTDDMLTILSAIKENYPKCHRITMYGSPLDILKKSEDELEKLGDAGVTMVYMGIESGNAKILENIKKGATPEMMIEAGQKMVKSSIKLSATLISGLGGKVLTNEHALDSAKVINAIQPDFVSLLTLMLTPGTVLYNEYQKGLFELLSPDEVLRENRLFVENLELKNSRFNSNHASNYVPINGMMPDEKNTILDILDQAIGGKRAIRSEHMRGL